MALTKFVLRLPNLVKPQLRQTFSLGTTYTHGFIESLESVEIIFSSRGYEIQSIRAVGFSALPSL